MPEKPAAMRGATVDSPRGPFTLSSAGNPVQDIYLRRVDGLENKVVNVAVKKLADPARGSVGIVAAGQSERLGEARFQVLRIQIERVRVTEGDEQTPTAEAVIVGHCPRLVAGAKQREVPADQRLEGGPGTVIRRAERLQLGPEGGRAGAAR